MIISTREQILRVQIHVRMFIQLTAVHLKFRVRMKQEHVIGYELKICKAVKGDIFEKFALNFA